MTCLRMCLFRFMFLGELGTCPENVIPTSGVEPWEYHQFPQGGMLKFTYKGRLLTIKIAYETLLDWKSKRWKHALVPALYIEIFVSDKSLRSRFLVEFQSSIFWQILANLGSFGQLWAVFAALTVANSMPQRGLNS
jgi:hypothetical protein